MDVYPLIFEPIFKPKIWGGRRLQTRLHKNLPGDGPVGESWEIVDLEDDQSLVAVGPARGKTLREIMDLWGAELLGRAPLFEGHFPLLIKYLDATETLSVQVHPDRAAAQRQGGRVRVKNEAWYVIHADPGGVIYRGLREGVDAKSLTQAIAENRVESVLQSIPVREGHCYYLPSGTVHALGAGVVVAEVQTPSDITYRLYDWNRVEPATGRPRPLHLDQALACLSYDTGPIAGEQKQHIASVWAAVTRLVHCESFTLERVRMIEGVEQPIAHAEMLIWMVLEGRGTIRHDGPASPLSFKTGDTVLIPAAIKNGVVLTQSPCMWLEITVPIASSLQGYERPPRERGATAGGSAGVVQLNVPDRRDGGTNPISEGGRTV